MECYEIALVARRTAIPAVLAALALTASAACSGGGGGSKGNAGANPTLATDPPTTTTTNPYAVPAVIDAAYVNRVLAALDAINGEVVRIAYRTRTIPAEARDRLTAIYGTQGILQFAIDGLQLDMSSGFKNYRAEGGNRISTVNQLMTAQASCIFAQVHRDFSAITTDTSAVVNPQWVALTPLDLTRDPNRYNPTPWTLVYDGFTRDRTAPPNPCAH